MILERLKQYIDSKGITVAAFERSVGMSNSSFGKSLKNKRAIGTDKLENILSAYPDISPVWLLTGVGDMLTNNAPNHHPNEEIVALKARNEVLKEELSEAKETISKQAKELGRCETHTQIIQQLRTDLEQAQKVIDQLTAGKNAPTHSHATTTASVAP